MSEFRVEEIGGQRLVLADCVEYLPTLEAGSVDCCVTSPPYWGLRDYGADGQLGLEATPEEYVARLVAVMREVRRVLADGGTLWLNLGDSYARLSSRGKKFDGGDFVGSDKSGARADIRPEIPNGLKDKDLCMIPARVALALQADGWWLRSDIIWHKPNPMPESVTDRPTSAHEHVFLLAKSARYYYDADAVREPLQAGSEQAKAFRHGKGYIHTGGWAADNAEKHEHGAEGDGPNPAGRNKRNVWTIATQPYKEAHFATFPEKLVEPCILAGCPPGGLVLDPFCGSGTVLAVAEKWQRRGLGCELNADYVDIACGRIGEVAVQPRLDFAAPDKPANVALELEMA